VTDTAVATIDTFGDPRATFLPPPGLSLVNCFSRRLRTCASGVESRHLGACVRPPQEGFQ
jgi:hypothetical protein